jgi:pyridoxamine 5'-phosphate oxidase
VAQENARPPARSIDVEALRRTYGEAGLAEADVAADPITQFDQWLATAVAEGVLEPNAMVAATASADGRPSARTVLLKGYDARGFTFFTNLGSRKGREATENPRASLVFPWYVLERQVVVVGDVEPVDRTETEAYWATRPYGSRVGAWASPQSQVVPDRATLDGRWESAKEQFPDADSVPLPEGWGGLRVVPLSVEFWQGRRDRMHDRLRYRRETVADPWTVERLAP